MRRIIVIMIVLACCINNQVSAQSFDRLAVSGGLTQLNYWVKSGSPDNSFSPTLGLEVRLNEWYINNFPLQFSFGMSCAKLSNQWNMPSQRVVVPLKDGDVALMDFVDFAENHSSNLFQLTPMLLVKELPINNRLGFGGGVSIGLLKGRWTSCGQISDSLTDAVTGVTLGPDINGYGLGTFTDAHSGSFSRFVWGIILELDYRINEYMFIGAYGNMNFVTGMKGHEIPIVERIGDPYANSIEYNGLVNSNQMIGAKIWSVGVKLGWVLGSPNVDSKIEPKDNNCSTLQLQVDTLSAQISRYRDSIAIIQTLGLDSNKRRMDILVKDYAKLCFSSPYDPDYYQYYRKLVNLDCFATAPYRDRCQNYLRLFDKYRIIQEEYNKMMSGFLADYKGVKRTDRLDRIKKYSIQLNAFKVKWDKEIQRLELHGLEDVPYISNQVDRNLILMDSWIEKIDCPYDEQDLANKLRIGE